MFDNRGQSALEYLMTYGWALIVIAIVIGVLIFVTSGATGGVTCQSSATGFVVKEAPIAKGLDGVKLSIQNTTGGAIKINSSTGNSSFSGNGVLGGALTDVNAITGNVIRNGTFTITGISGPANPGSFQGATVDINYTTQGGLTTIATISCSGSVA